jgi:ABC-type branched-subunit amino acid transport system substrate-binding protein
VIFNTSNQGLAQLMRALEAAKWVGTPVMLHELAPGEVGSMIPLTQLEGLMAGIVSWSTDSPNPVAKEAKDDYVAKYGKWDDPGFTDLDTYFTYRAAVQAAGTIDGDKVAETLAAGLKFNGPHGEGQMVPRPDAGVADRTVCLTMQLSMCTVKAGAPANIQTESLADVQKYCAAVWGAGKK